MNLEHTDSNVSLRQRDVDELTLALLQLLRLQKRWGIEELIDRVLREKTLFTLSIEATGLEDNIKTKHTVQFVSDTFHQEL